MLRWILVLMAFSLIAGLLGWGFIPIAAAGLARTLCCIFLALLAASLVAGLLRY